MKYDKKLNKDIALLLDVTIETLSHWTAIYEEGGIELLCKLHYEGRKESVMTPYIDQIKKHIEEEQVSTLKSLRDWLNDSLDISVGISWLQEFCKKNSIFLIKNHDSYLESTNQKKFKKNLQKKYLIL
jgi:transposase